MTCPLCKTHDTGKIGRERYFCHICCLEWTENSGELKIFSIASDGILFRLKGEQGLETNISPGSLDNSC